MKAFPRGARVYVDGKDPAYVWEAFPKGSTSYAFPHYILVHDMGRARCARFAVAWARVGVLLG